MKAFWKRERVFCIAAACAVLSLCFVPPDSTYLTYVDWRVLGLLLSLMTVVALARRCGVFLTLAHRLTRGGASFRRLRLTLVLLPYFTSMCITNDVALLTFVPFTITLLEMANRRDAVVGTVVWQTVAANLGSMALPVGNPQNLYLYDRFGLTAPAFFAVVLPLALAGLVLVTAGGAAVKNEPVQASPLAAQPPVDPRRAVFYGVLFALCLLTVFRILPWQVLLAVVLLGALCTDRRALGEVDYILLLTFICFFVFSGNMGRIPAVREVLSGWMARDALVTSVAASQIISNVPAAVLLSGFTDSWQALLAGVDIGGLGTPVASLASLISLKCYLRAEGARAGKFLLYFTAVNVFVLAVLYVCAVLLL